MRKIDYSFFKTALLPGNFLGITNSIAELKALGHTRKRDFQHIFTLLICYKELDKRFAVINSKNVSKRERIEQTILNSLLPLSKREIN